MSPLEDKILGCLLGGLIGDAMGAPVEGKRFEDIEAQYGPDGVRDFSGVGTDDTAIREQLIQALLEHDGYVNCDRFATTFLATHKANYRLWWVPVRNMFHKLQAGVALPVDAGWGNTPSSSSAMAISPIGIINAANPRQAALETFDVATLVHSGPSGFCRDAACAMAAAIAQAFSPTATVENILAAATDYLHESSAHIMRSAIRTGLDIAREEGSYPAFRARFYHDRLEADICDSRETIPVTLAIFLLAKGDMETAILWGANFGRDTDTIGTMVGGLCGALHGYSALPEGWRAKISPEILTRYQEFASRLSLLVQRRAEAATQYAAHIAALHEQG